MKKRIGTVRKKRGMAEVLKTFGMKLTGRKKGRLEINPHNTFQESWGRQTTAKNNT